MLPVCLVRRVPKHLSRCQLTNNLSIEPVELNLDLEVESTTVLYTGLELHTYKLFSYKLCSCLLLLSEGDQAKPRNDREARDSKL